MCIFLMRASKVIVAPAAPADATYSTIKENLPGVASHMTHQTPSADGQKRGAEVTPSSTWVPNEE
jgi:hypothetical protein